MRREQTAASDIGGDLRSGLFQRNRRAADLGCLLVAPRSSATNLASFTTIDEMRQFASVWHNVPFYFRNRMKSLGNFVDSLSTRTGRGDCHP